MSNYQLNALSSKRSRTHGNLATSGNQLQYDMGFVFVVGIREKEKGHGGI